MVRSLHRAACLAGAIALLASTAVHAGRTPPTPAQWRALQLKAADRAERIMRQADHQKSLLARYETMVSAATEGDTNPAFGVIFGQYLGWYQTYIGDYPHAAQSFSIQETLQPGDRPSPLAAGFTAQPALDAIAALARDRRAVFFNEAHHLPLTRTLTIQMLARLRAEGFDTFAAETLYASDTQLASRGYPIEGSGFYTNEPLCAEMVRTALKLGYRVVAYEDDGEASADQRERAQARNLYQRVFQRDPHARLVVDAGYAHIQEAGAYLGGSSMAEHLRELSGIDPLTVEQTMLIPHPQPEQNHPLYAALVQQLTPSQPMVFVDKAGKPWALREGYDVSVLFPPEVMRRGRPTWLALGGLREPYRVQGDELCKGQYPCLVEARYAAEGDDAIAADRVVFDPAPPFVRQDKAVRPMDGATSTELYLRPGTFRLQASDAQGHMLGRRTISVGH